VHDRARPDELQGSCGPRAFVPLVEDAEYMDGFRGSRKVVSCEGERVVGFTGVDGDYICWLYADPEHYGHGIGRRLLRHAISLAGPQAFTVTLAGNARAL
jgi:GNAT superfamily N-acetyltransferase